MTHSDAERERQLAAILDQALTLETSDRGAYLDRACSGDTALRAELERLLAVEGVTFLESPAVALLAPLLGAAQSDEADPLAGGIVGPFRVLRRLARGGMGAVYLAERADGQFEQRVALKLIKRGMDSEEIHRRFLAERRILAGLNHPCIARLLDGGVTSAGQPWFAMEYVDGAPITVHSDQRRLEVAERLRLFADVCRAVGYAHQNLVVHRDLKPSNVLVTADGQVKLLDFGIAKLLHDAPGQETLTREGARVMTPEYAAPEQVLGGATTTATDVYALGAVLYELLSGSRAHRLERSTPAEIERVVRDVTPQPPSAAVAHDPAGGTARGTDVRRLRRRLRGDLDTIVLKALQKEPARRYASADALLGDLERHLAGLPVQARPDSALYRAAKFARRHLAGVAAAVAIFASLVAGLAGTAWQAGVARREAVTATQVKDFVKDLFKVSTPVESRGREITARELLQRGTRRADSALAGQPEVQLELLHFLGEVNRDLGFYPRADTLLARATALARRLHGRGGREEAHELATWATVEQEQGNYVRAESLLTAALDIRRRRGVGDSVVAVNLEQLAEALDSRGEYAAAESLYRQSLSLSRRVYGERHLETAKILDNLGVVLWRKGVYLPADSAHRAAFGIRRSLLDSGHPDVLASMHNLAGDLQAQGKLDEAEALQRRVVAGKRLLYPAGHPDLAISLQQLEAILEDRGRYAQAESALVEALAIRQKFLGPSHPETIVLEANLGVLRYRMGDLPGAEAPMRSSLASYRRVLGSDHLMTLSVLQNLGAILSERGRYAEAEPLLQEALAARRRVLGDSAPVVAQTLRNLAVIRYRQGRLGEAERYFRKVIQIERATLPEDHPWIALASSGLGGVLTAAGRPAEAEPLLRASLDVQRKQHGAADPRTLDTESLLGSTLAALGSRVEAESLLAASYRQLRANPYSGKELPGAARRWADYLERHGRRREAARVRTIRDH
jgi:eukaryotic-like serine/threonine-protein kinase